MQAIELSPIFRKIHKAGDKVSAFIPMQSAALQNVLVILLWRFVSSFFSHDLFSIFYPAHL